MTEGERLKLAYRLSDLFLDTEIRPDLPRVADFALRLGASPEDVAQLWIEVTHPIVVGNMLSPVGVWDGFDPEWFEARARRRLRASEWRRKLSRLRYRVSGGLNDPTRQALERFMALLDPLDTPARRAVTTLANRVYDNLGLHEGRIALEAGLAQTTLDILRDLYVGEPDEREPWAVMEARARESL